MKSYEITHPVTVQFYLSLFYSSGFVLLIIQAIDSFLSMHKWGHLPQYFIMSTLSTNIAPKILFIGAILYSIVGGIIGYGMHNILTDPQNLYGLRQFLSRLLTFIFSSFIYCFVYRFSQNIVPTFLMALINPLGVILLSIRSTGIIIAGLMSTALVLFPFITPINTKVQLSQTHWMCHKGPLIIPAQVIVVLLIICSNTLTVPLRSDCSGLTEIAVAALSYTLVGVIAYLNKAELSCLLGILKIEQTRQQEMLQPRLYPLQKIVKEQSTEQEWSLLLENPDEITTAKEKIKTVIFFCGLIYYIGMLFVIPFLLA